MRKTVEQKEKQKKSVAAFSRTYDKDLAYRKAKCTDDEISLLEADQEFQERLEYYLIEQKEDLVEAAKDLLKSDDEKIKSQAIFKLGELIYPEFFLRQTKKTLIDVEDIVDFFSQSVKK